MDLDYESIKNKYPHEMSGGECQRAMIAFILSKNPSFIIADETTTGLDVSRQRKVIDTFKEIHSLNPDLTMIFISHDFGFLSHVVDEYYVLYGGFICEHIIDKKQFLDLESLHPYTQDLISSLIPGEDSCDIMHDQISTTLLSKPITGCPYFNSKCNDESCKNKSHFHNEIPPMFDENGNSSNINLNGKWKRSRSENVK